MKLIWLASYPKSGNTWLRFCVSVLITGKIESSQKVKQIVPDVYEAEFAPLDVMGNGFVFGKTHYKFSEQMPAYEHTGGFIYIVRNPIDVLASSYSYQLRNTEIEPEDEAAVREKYILNFIKACGDPTWIEHGMGSWIDNVQSWIEARANYPNLFLKYEDMRDDPRKAMKLVAEYIGLKRSDDEITSAVKATSFAAMKELEAREMSERIPGMFYSDGRDYLRDSNKRFVNQGGMRGRDAVFTPEVLELLQSRFRPLLTPLGYEE